MISQLFLLLENLINYLHDSIAFSLLRWHFLLGNESLNSVTFNQTLFPVSGVVYRVQVYFLNCVDDFLDWFVVRSILRILESIFDLLEPGFDFSRLLFGIFNSNYWQC